MHAPIPLVPCTLQVPLPGQRSVLKRLVTELAEIALGHCGRDYVSSWSWFRSNPTITGAQLNQLVPPSGLAHTDFFRSWTDVLVTGRQR